MITGYLKVIPDARVCNIISKCPKYRFVSKIDFPKCRREIAASLNDFMLCQIVGANGKMLNLMP